MLAATWRAPEQIETADLAAPEPGLGEALVEVAWCGICGSDLHAFRRGMGIRPGQVLGHELSGRILSAPGVDGLSPGDRVVVRPVLPCGRCPRCFAGETNLCDDKVLIGFDVAGGMAERLVVPRASLPGSLLVLPDGPDLRMAALVEPFAVGLRAVRQAAATPADSVLVVGCGPIGLAAVSFLASAGARPLVGVDPSPLRRRKAIAMGATAAIDPTDDDADKALGSARGGRPAFDVAVDCAGVESSIGLALRSVRRGGRVVVAALYGTKIPVSIDRIVDGEVKLLGSFAYTDELHRVIDLMAAGILDAEGLITQEFELSDVGEAFAVQSRPADSVKVLLRVGGEDGDESGAAP
ncbi:MAG: alcohol dehydrogenase catalytic domain-containing protein [Actinobacteria bacterium]|nr:alcohol dehydrogenase catalytic domain-containing protein [Actinomycetota bacterium]